MSENPETRLLAWLAGQREAMVTLLAELVNIDSPSDDKAGVDRVGEVLARFLATHDVAVTALPQPAHGDCLRATIGEPAADGRSSVLLLGHRDTVFPPGEAARRPFRVQGEIATGPGIADMKAGLVMNAFLLAGFRRTGAAPAPLVALFTGDEEIGSPASRPVTEAEARRARAVLNSEPGRPTGGVVTARKGGVFLRLAITGKAAHAGGSFSEGISAIEELARKVQAIHKLTDLERGITLNVGLVAGGQSVNTVAPWAEGRIDLRYVEAADRDRLLARLQAIAGQSFVAGTQAELTISGEFLPLRPTEASERLFALYRDAAAASGFATKSEFSGGCADSGFTAAAGAPTLCAVGPVGGKGHSPDEFLDLASLLPRTLAAARTILHLERAGL